MHRATRGVGYQAKCPNAAHRAATRTAGIKTKVLKRSALLCTAGGWHGFREQSGMTFLLLLFLGLGGLLCGLVAIDHQASTAVERIRVRDFEKH
jgi:hypothetical protein